MLFEESGIAPSGVRLLACDISRRALSRARKGSYSAWSVRGERAMALPESFLRRSGKHYEVAERFRKQVNFFYLNLAGKGYPSAEYAVEALDLILCRNVLIYLDAATIRHVAQRLYDSLAPGGYLIPGPSDPLLSGLAPFEAQLTPGGLVYHKPVKRLVTSTGQVSVPETAPAPAFVAPASGVKRERSSRRASSANALSNIPKAQIENDGVAADIRGSVSSEELDLQALLYAQALLCMQQGDDEQALAQLKKLLYLDSSLAVVHFTCGLLYSRLAKIGDAQRSYRNAIQHAGALPDKQLLPLSDGEPAGLLVQAAQQQLNALHSRLGDSA